MYQALWKCWSTIKLRNCLAKQQLKCKNKIKFQQKILFYYIKIKNIIALIYALWYNEENNIFYGR